MKGGVIVFTLTVLLQSVTGRFLPPNQAPTRQIYNKYFMDYPVDWLFCILQSFPDAADNHGCSFHHKQHDFKTAPLYYLGSNKEADDFMGSPPNEHVFMVTEYNVSMHLLGSYHEQISKRMTAMYILREDNHEAEAGHNLSPAGKQPNAKWNLPAGSDHSWNPEGHNVLPRVVDIPIQLVITTATIQELRQKSKHNVLHKLAYPRWVGEMFVNMYAHALNFTECMNDTRYDDGDSCSPLGGNSAWGIPLDLPRTGEEYQPKFIVITGAATGNSMFFGWTLAAQTARSNSVAMLAAFDALARLYAARGKPVTEQDIVPLFFFASGDEYGYTGTERFIKDMVDGVPCSNDPEDHALSNLYCTRPFIESSEFQQLGALDVEYVINIDQPGLGFDDFYYRAYPAQTPAGKAKSDAMANSLKSVKNPQNFKPATNASNIPPVSSGRWHSHGSADSSEPGTMILTGYDDSFREPTQYFSVMDNATISDKSVKIAADAILKIVFDIIKQPGESLPESNITLIQEMVYCVQYNFSCDMALDALYGIEKTPAQTPSSYAYPWAGRRGVGSPLLYFYQRYMATLTTTLGINGVKTESNCVADWDCPHDSLCLKTPNPPPPAPPTTPSEAEGLSSSLVKPEGTCWKAVPAQAHRSFPAQLDWEQRNKSAAKNTPGWEFAWKFDEPLTAGAGESDWSGGQGSRVYLQGSLVSQLIPFILGIATFIGSFGAVKLASKMIPRMAGAKED